MKSSLFLSLFLWSLVVEAQSQTYPYVSFMGETLPDHSYMDISLVGNDQTGTDSVQCHTNVVTCCRSINGIHRGDWFPPGSDNRLPFPAQREFVFENREAQRVDIRRRNSTSPTGLYRCDIHVREEVGEEPARKSVYVGLYTRDEGEGKINIAISVLLPGDGN